MDLRHNFERLLTQAMAAQLKAQGFERAGHTLRRVHRHHTEQYQFQGSRSNVPHLRCVYYLNCGVELPRVPPWLYGRIIGAHPNWRGWTAGILWSRRADELLPGAPAHWEITPGTDPQATARAMADVLLQVSPLLAAQARRVRAELWPMRLFAAIAALVGWRPKGP